MKFLENHFTPFRLGLQRQTFGVAGGKQRSARSRCSALFRTRSRASYVRCNQ
jgi:hypothetical protein